MRIPGASSGVPINSIPAVSRAFCIAAMFVFVLFGTPDSNSTRLMVLVLTLDAADNLATLQPSA